MNMPDAVVNTNETAPCGSRRAQIAASIRVGPRPEAVEYMRQGDAEADNWRAICQKCGIVLKGTIAQIKEHTCGEQSRASAEPAECVSLGHRPDQEHRPGSDADTDRARDAA